MKHDSKLAKEIEAEDFIITAEFLPHASTDSSSAVTALGSVSDGLTAVNVADNPHGPVMSSLAGSVALMRAGIEPVYQIVTRDRNRIAIQSDLLGAVSLGIKNVLCLSGHHQALTVSPESSNVYDIDSIQLIAVVKQMRDQGVLLEGTRIEGAFPVFIGAAANPFMKPLDLNIIRLEKKVEAGAEFIQTQAVFDTNEFRRWVEAIQGIAEKAAIIAGILPLESAAEAEALVDKYTDLSIPDHIIERIRSAGDEDAQRKEGVSISIGTINDIREIHGVKGIHLLSGGKEHLISEIITASGL
ncbi:MAG: methylenetetrahydrofolate reductase [Thermodesulfobacteriota bacterium]|nr:methylenetetrahydrofolate reductase [Thermodesulfobacteriota bacterium]